MLLWRFFNKKTHHLRLRSGIQILLDLVVTIELVF